MPEISAFEAKHVFKSAPREIEDFWGQETRKSYSVDNIVGAIFLGILIVTAILGAILAAHALGEPVLF